MHIDKIHTDEGTNGSLELPPLPKVIIFSYFIYILLLRDECPSRVCARDFLNPALRAGFSKSCF